MAHFDKLSDDWVCRDSSKAHSILMKNEAVSLWRTNLFYMWEGKQGLSDDGGAVNGGELSDGNMPGRALRYDFLICRTTGKQNDQ